MSEIVTAMIPLAGGGRYGWSARGDYAREQLERIAGICGARTGTGPLPADCFGCDIEEVSRDEAIRLAAPEPGCFTVCEPYVVIKLAPEIVRPRVCVVRGEKMTGERFGFMWRRFYYLALLPYVWRREAGVVHGVLVRAPDGRGAVISGPSGVGKSTAARRLPPPWRVLADDCLLVTCLADGFYAQPVPTWSIYYAATAPERSFRCGDAVKLSHIFLLDRGADRAEKLDFQQAAMGFTRSAGDMTRMLAGSIPREVSEPVYRRAFGIASAMARTMPCHHLFATLDGEFWNAMGAAMESGR